MARPARKSATAYHHGDLRAALVLAATEEAGKRGVESVQLRELARRLGVSPGAPFRHFKDRTALLVAVAEQGFAQLRDLLASEDETISQPLEQARARGVAYVRFAVEQPGLFRIMHAAQVIRASKKIKSIQERNKALLQTLLGRAPIGGTSAEIAGRGAEVLAAQALTYGLASMIVNGMLGDVSPADAVRLALEVTGVLGGGLGARAGS